MLLQLSLFGRDSDFFDACLFCWGWTHQWLSCWKWYSWIYLGGYFDANLWALFGGWTWEKVWGNSSLLDSWGNRCAFLWWTSNFLLALCLRDFADDAVCLHWFLDAHDSAVLCVEDWWWLISYFWTVVHGCHICAIITILLSLSWWSLHGTEWLTLVWTFCWIYLLLLSWKIGWSGLAFAFADGLFSIVDLLLKVFLLHLHLVCELQIRDQSSLVSLSLLLLSSLLTVH